MAFKLSLSKNSIAVKRSIFIPKNQNLRKKKIQVRLITIFSNYLFIHFYLKITNNNEL